VRTKGYTLADIRSTLKEAGYEVGEKTLRDIIREAEAKKPRRRSGTSPAKIKAVSAHTDQKDNVKVSPEQ
ncbi:molybdopterin-guanine dinucleotide biosynthesis protein MobC, partial [Escherichia coli]|nr:molybdopterin-guanine dinucleotide biosynthesis protein MobC [Escherichia coli]